jgi:hypothetical protein
MKLLTPSTAYEDTIRMANALDISEDIPTLFHFYWKGVLNEKHYISIKSCRRFHPTSEILLWTESGTPNEWLHKCQEICTVQPFVLSTEMESCFVREFTHLRFGAVTYYSDFIRLLLLYKYGGIWADLDCFFLRNFSPLLRIVEDYPAVYTWELQPYPNNAVFISPIKENPKLKAFIEYMYNKRAGWGFQQENVIFDTPVDLLVLPCSWFDPGWITNPYNISFGTFMAQTNKKVTLDTFFKGSFCFHWHNRWDVPIHETSMIRQLANQL